MSVLNGAEVSDMKRKITVILVGIILALSTGACGNASDKAEQKELAKEETKATEEDAEAQDETSIEGEPEKEPQEDTQTANYDDWTIEKNSDDFAKEMDKCSLVLDDLKKRAQGFIDNPDTYTLDANLSYYEDIKAPLNLSSRLLKIDIEDGGLSEWEHYDKWREYESKKKEFADLDSQMPSELAD